MYHKQYCLMREGGVLPGSSAQPVAGMSCADVVCADADVVCADAARGQLRLRWRCSAFGADVVCADAWK